jgi:Ser/Thr protein kinase RdoA (MazF antagonist)
LAAPPSTLPVVYATASAGAVADFLAEHYALGGTPSCALLARGFNDTYAVRTAAGDRFVLRLSGRRARGPADVAAETAFLAYLDQAGVPVAAPLATRDGALFAAADLPDGARPAVLFRHADGRAPDLDRPADARAQGVTLACLHDAADTFAARAAGRQRLDLDHLLHRQVAAVMALDLDAPAARRDLAQLAERLADAVGRTDDALTRRAAMATATG